ncbi:hypothetical protein MRB53_028428 [Persea americana]|uniref:Uncharacterized protein n=1 Tax=Persea americana TaxID=3435 RepID=A0ACC2KFH2_PERAE|nr:hypothetical protein MRB53_028428 [Persea americana]
MALEALYSLVGPTAPFSINEPEVHPLEPWTKRPCQDSPPPPSPRRNTTHQCSVCFKCFPSGQALGGHKLCHYYGGGAASCNSSGVTSSKGGGAASPVIMKFNLNLPVLLEMGLFFGREQEATAESEWNTET